MMLLVLALKSLRARALTTGLTVFSIALSVIAAGGGGIGCEVRRRRGSRVRFRIRI